MAPYKQTKNKMIKKQKKTKEHFYKCSQISNSGLNFVGPAPLTHYQFYSNVHRADHACLSFDARFWLVFTASSIWVSCADHRGMF